MKKYHTILIYSYYIILCYIRDRLTTFSLWYLRLKVLTHWYTFCLVSYAQLHSVPVSISDIEIILSTCFVIMSIPKTYTKDERVLDPDQEYKWRAAATLEDLKGQLRHWRISKGYCYIGGSKRSAATLEDLKGQLRHWRISKGYCNTGGSQRSAATLEDLKGQL